MDGSARTKQDHLTNSERNLVRRLRCRVRSFFDTIGGDLPSPKDLLRWESGVVSICNAQGVHIADLISAIVKRRMSVHIMPRISLRFPSMMSAKAKIRDE